MQRWKAKGTIDSALRVHLLAVGAQHDGSYGSKCIAHVCLLQRTSCMKGKRFSASWARVSGRYTALPLGGATVIWPHCAEAELDVAGGRFTSCILYSIDIPAPQYCNSAPVSVQTYLGSKAASSPELKPVLVWGERAVVLHEERALGAQQPDRRETMARLLMLLLGVLLEVCSGVSVNRGGYPSFTDEIPFKITWPGPEFTLVSCLLRKEQVCCQRRVAEMLYHLRSWRCCPPTALRLSCLTLRLKVTTACLSVGFQPPSGAFYNEEDFVIMTTAEKERYKCLLPSLTAGDEVGGVKGYSDKFVA